MKLALSIALSSNPRTWPILNGQAAADGIDLIPSVVHPSELFWRQLRFADFDVSEMSFSSLIMAKTKGDDRWVGLPIFTTRRFFHTEILVRCDSRIETPADLKGKRVSTGSPNSGTEVIARLQSALFDWALHPKMHVTTPNEKIAAYADRQMQVKNGVLIGIWDEAELAAIRKRIEAQ